MTTAFDPSRTAETLVSFIRTAVTDAGFTTGVIGVSGGVDSATSLALAVRALGPDHVVPVLLPYGSLSTQGVLDAMEMIASIGIAPAKIVRIDIQPPIDALARVTMPDPLRRGNMMARMRMIALFDMAKKYRALVIGTENRTEHLLGYYTRFGDEASDLEPLTRLYKTQVYAVAREVGVTKTILTKAPTAGLWPNQTDEGEFGFTYGDADGILALYADGHRNPDEIAAEGFSPAVVARVLERVRTNAFKDMLPYKPA